MSTKKPRQSLRDCTRAAALAALLTLSAGAEAALDLSGLSIEELTQIEVTSVSKSAQPLSNAPSAIYVITHDDIVRSGASSLPEILRLAPNLQVAQTSASQYVITARGLSGSPTAQNLPNKLLVLIDGRSVYTPLYSGVYWDMQDALPADIDRIEVISGPGATLWGANAVNGVINIITRKSSETQGVLLTAEAGTEERSAALRYGGSVGETLSYRFYVRGYEDDQTKNSSGDPAQDDWWRVQGGFRVDWTASSRDTVTFQGNGYDGSRAQPNAPYEDIRGRNFLFRWNRTSAAGSTLQVQTYYDRTERDSDGSGFAIDIYDLDIQHSFALDARNDVVWGGGVRVSRHNLIGVPQFYFEPQRRTLRLANAFVQDTLRIGDAVHLTLGLKLEDDPYSGVSLLPNARATWQLGGNTMLWAAVSRAVRSPTPFDRDVVEKIGSTLFLVGGSDFRTEKLTAFELGARARPSSNLSLSVSAFYNHYDDLRSVEFNRVTLLPLEWGNEIRGHTYGFEAWGDYGIAPWWKLSAAFSLLKEKFVFKANATSLLLSGLPGVEQQGNDPEYQGSLKSSMNLGSKATLDAAFRFIGARPEPHVPAYIELDARAAYNISTKVQLSVTARNLLHARHQEYPAPDANPVQRKILAGLQWQF